MEKTTGQESSKKIKNNNIYVFGMKAEECALGSRKKISLAGYVHNSSCFGKLLQVPKKLHKPENN